MKKTTIIILLVTIFFIGIGVVIYFLFFAKPESTTPGVGLPTAGSGTSTGTTPVLTTAPNTPTAVTPRLVRISAGPVVRGAVVTSNPRTASSSAEFTVNYIERQSGNVYSYSSVSKENTRTSNKTIPGIQSAAWLPNASMAFVRYLSGEDFTTINTYSLPSNGSAGFFLSQNIADLSVSSTSVLAVASGVNGSVASITHTDGTHSSQVFSTPLSLIRASFSGKNQYLVFTKPSSTLLGNVFLVDAAGVFSRIFGPQKGLAALASPSGKWVLVSYVSSPSSLAMVLINTSSGERVPLPIATLVEKCVWTNDESSLYCGVPLETPLNAAYPDDWYQGVVHFSDRIWNIQVSGRYAQLVLDFTKEAGAPLDAEALVVDPHNTTLVFMNKNDLSLWGYSL